MHCTRRVNSSMTYAVVGTPEDGMHAYTDAKPQDNYLRGACGHSLRRGSAGIDRLVSWSSAIERDLADATHIII